MHNKCLTMLLFNFYYNETYKHMTNLQVIKRKKRHSVSVSLPPTRNSWNYSSGTVIKPASYIIVIWIKKKLLSCWSEVGGLKIFWSPGFTDNGYFRQDYLIRAIPQSAVLEETSAIQTLVKKKRKKWIFHFSLPSHSNEQWLKQITDKWGKQSKRYR